MRGLWLRSSAICLFVVLLKISDGQKPSIACSDCTGYHICGFRGSNLPECINGHPCTWEQYRLCVKMLNRSPDRRCDRPGIFPDPGNSANFYQCSIKRNTSEIVKIPSKCPSNTTFDASTVRCLHDDERTMLRATEEQDVRFRSSEESFECKTYGVFPDPDDCKKYHVCDSKLQRREFYCPSGTYFNNVTCSETKTDQCIKKLINQSRNQIKQGHDLYRRLRHALDSRHNYAPSLPQGVIQKDFQGVANMRYKMYGLAERSDAEALADTRETLSALENVIENIIIKYAVVDNNTYDLLKLQAAIQNETVGALNNTQQLELNLKIKLCQKENETLSTLTSHDNPKILSLTIILITDCKCPTCPTTENQFAISQESTISTYEKTARETPTTSKTLESSEDPFRNSTSSDTKTITKEPVIVGEIKEIDEELQTSWNHTDTAANEQVLTTFKTEDSVTTFETEDAHTSPGPTLNITKPQASLTYTSGMTAKVETTESVEEVHTTPETMTTYTNTTTTTKKPKLFRCPHVGYFRDPADCHSFYRCRRVPVREKNCVNCVTGRWNVIISHHTCKNGLWFSNFFWKCVRPRPLAC